MAIGDKLQVSPLNTFFSNLRTYFNKSYTKSVSRNSSGVVSTVYHKPSDYIASEHKLASSESGDATGEIISKTLIQKYCYALYDLTQCTTTVPGTGSYVIKNKYPNNTSGSSMYSSRVQMLAYGYINDSRKFAKWEQVAVLNDYAATSGHGFYRSLDCTSNNTPVNSSQGSCSSQCSGVGCG